jgi:hypothetical protein
MRFAHTSTRVAHNVRLCQLVGAVRGAILAASSTTLVLSASTLAAATWAQQEQQQQQQQLQLQLELRQSQQEHAEQEQPRGKSVRSMVRSGPVVAPNVDPMAVQQLDPMSTPQSPVDDLASLLSFMADMLGAEKLGGIVVTIGRKLWHQRPPGHGRRRQDAAQWMDDVGGSRYIGRGNCSGTKANGCSPSLLARGGRDGEGEGEEDDVEVNRELSFNLVVPKAVNSMLACLHHGFRPTVAHHHRGTVNLALFIAAVILTLSARRSSRGRKQNIVLK